ncbi:hypothetical protein [Micavibrio aeruginosavorus]|uniref:hypothetical protein n=1 Tax=Micavibrio aeruginosavorus TaxID=349221 RepID=UPI003F4AB65B
MKSFIINPIIIFVSVALGICTGVIFVGLPVVETIITLNGLPIDRGYLTEAEIGQVVSGASTTSSYLKIYGVSLPGAPIFWILGIIATCGFLGYQISLCIISKIKAKTVSTEAEIK